MRGQDDPFFWIEVAFIAWVCFKIADRITFKLNESKKCPHCGGRLP